MLTVLDIDLDLFVDPRTEGGSPKCDGRPIGVEAWQPERVAAYLYEKIGLDRQRKFPGRTFEVHEELLDELERFESPVRLYHLDAHADLGIGQDCYRFYTEFLALGLDERRSRFREFEPRQGDFLLYAIACGFVSELIYVTHPEVFKYQPDIPIGMARWDHEYDDGLLNLFRFHGTQSDYGGRRGRKTLDRRIPVRMRNRDTFDCCGMTFDHVFVTRSPEYTPKSADAAFHVLCDLLYQGT